MRIEIRTSKIFWLQLDLLWLGWWFPLMLHILSSHHYRLTRRWNILFLGSCFLCQLFLEHWQDYLLSSCLHFLHISTEMSPYQRPPSPDILYQLTALTKVITVCLTLHRRAKHYQAIPMSSFSNALSLPTHTRPRSIRTGVLYLSLTQEYSRKSRLRVCICWMNEQSYKFLWEIRINK